MKELKFFKTKLIRIIIASLMLSVYVCTVLLNYASEEITAGNFFATLVFLLSLVLLTTFASIKKHPPLLWAARGWMIVSVLFCFLAAVFTAAEAEFAGSFGAFVGYGIMLFVSPYFGFFYVIGDPVTVGLLSMLISFLMLFLPLITHRMAERRRIIKKYE